MFGVEGLRLVFGRGLRDRLVPPQVAALGPRHLDTGAAHHQYVLDAVSIFVRAGALRGYAGRLLRALTARRHIAIRVERLVDGRLEWGGLAATPLTVGGDDQPGASVVHALA